MTKQGSKEAAFLPDVMFLNKSGPPKAPGWLEMKQWSEGSVDKKSYRINQNEQ